MLMDQDPIPTFSGSSEGAKQKGTHYSGFQNHGSNRAPSLSESSYDGTPNGDRQWGSSSSHQGSLSSRQSPYLRPVYGMKPRSFEQRRKYRHHYSSGAHYSTPQNFGINKGKNLRFESHDGVTNSRAAYDNPELKSGLVLSMLQQQAELQEQVPRSQLHDHASFNGRRFDSSASAHGSASSGHGHHSAQQQFFVSASNGQNPVVGQNHNGISALEHPDQGQHERSEENFFSDTPPSFSEALNKANFSAPSPTNSDEVKTQQSGSSGDLSAGGLPASRFPHHSSRISFPLSPVHQVPSFSDSAHKSQLENNRPEDDDDNAINNFSIAKRDSRESKNSGTGTMKSTSEKFAYVPVFSTKKEGVKMSPGGSELMKLELKFQDDRIKHQYGRMQKRFIAVLCVGVFSLILILLIVFASRKDASTNQQITRTENDYYSTSIMADKGTWCDGREANCDFRIVFDEELRDATFGLHSFDSEEDTETLSQFVDTTQIFGLPYFYPYGITLEISRLRELETNVSIQIPVPLELLEKRSSNTDPEEFGIDVLARFEQSHPFGKKTTYVIYEMLERFQDFEGYEWVNIPPSAFTTQPDGYLRTNHKATLFIAYSKGVTEVAVIEDESGEEQNLQGNLGSRTGSKNRRLQDDPCLTSRLLCPFAEGSNCNNENLDGLTFVQDSFFGITYAASDETDSVKVLPASSGFVERVYVDEQTGTKGVVVSQSGDEFVRILYLGFDEVNVNVGDQLGVTGPELGTLSGNAQKIHMQSLPNEATFQSAHRKNRVDPNACLERISNAKITVTDIGAIKDDKFKLTLSVGGQTLPLVNDEEESVCDELEISQVFHVPADDLRTLNAVQLRIVADDEYNVLQDFDGKATFSIVLDGLTFLESSSNDATGVIDKQSTQPFEDFFLIPAT
mmetsp:Transcript_18835/g.24611  ORF Transcript_18835/g.24611 Transcript_18835/m.24611 type:complete len:906 (+) Transcript_18835:156-2873(+)